MDNMNHLEKILSFFELEDLTSLLVHIDYLFVDGDRASYIVIANKVLTQAIELYCTDVPADEFDLDLDSIVAHCTMHYEYGADVDTDMAETMVKHEVSTAVINELDNLTQNIPFDILPSKSFFDSLLIEVLGCDDFVNSHINTDYCDDDWDYDRYDEPSVSTDGEIDLIFNR